MSDFREIYIENRMFGHEKKADKISASKTVCSLKTQEISGFKLRIYWWIWLIVIGYLNFTINQ